MCAMTAARWLLIAIPIAMACAGPMELFLHDTHRQLHGIDPVDLIGMQVFASKEIMAHEISTAGTKVERNVLVVPRAASGIVREVGTDWLRVAFERDAEGAFFVAVPAPEGASYRLAGRETADGPLLPMTELFRQVIRQRDREFHLVYGADAQLLIGKHTLSNLISGP